MFPRDSRLVLILAAAFLATPGVTSAGDSAQMRQMHQSMAVNQLHHYNQKEIELSELASQKATSPEVKLFAQTIVKDHRANDQRLQDVAKRSQIPVQDYSASTYDRASLEQLRKAEAAQFDRLYLALMDLGHEHAIRDLRSTSRRVQDPQIKALLDETLPKIREHHRQARQQLGKGSMEQAGESASN